MSSRSSTSVGLRPVRASTDVTLRERELELDLRERELDLRERELDLRERELDLRERELHLRELELRGEQAPRSGNFEVRLQRVTAVTGILGFVVALIELVR